MRYKKTQGKAGVAMRWSLVSSWAITHFDFHKLAVLWLARLINNHVRIYGSNVAEGFSAFQRRSCSNSVPISEVFHQVEVFFYGKICFNLCISTEDGIFLYILDMS